MIISLQTLNYRKNNFAFLVSYYNFVMINQNVTMAENTEFVLAELQGKLDQLIRSYHMCIEANAMLTDEIEQLRLRLERKNAEHDALQGRFEALKIARVISETPEGKNEAKAKINAIVREVDHCIALLNR